MTPARVLDLYDPRAVSGWALCVCGRPLLVTRASQATRHGPTCVPPLPRRVVVVMMRAANDGGR